MKGHTVRQTIAVAITSLSVWGVSADQAAPMLEEIVVTAQKKAESLQDTPIALDAFGEQALEREGIANVGDIANNIPAVTIAPFPINTTTLRIYIRGIGLIDAQITQDPPVGVYIDGAYIARSAALATDIADLTRIEVLRGPQGTLYGRNSTGGAVNLITRRPDVNSQSFKQSLTIGNRNLLTSKTMLNLPLGNKAAAKMAYYTKQVDGYIENTGLGGDFGDSDTDGYRIDLSWDISEQWRLDYAYDRTYVENTNMTYSHTRPAPAIVDSSIPPSTGVPITNLINSGAQQFYNHNYSEKRPNKIHSAVAIPEAENEISGHQLTLAWDYADNHQLKYIYAQRELIDSTPTNLSTGALTDGYRLDNEAIFGFPIADNPGDTALCTPCVGRSVQYDSFVPTMEQTQSSHELQLSGELFDGRFSYITGLYYFEEEAWQSPGKIGHLLSAPLGSDSMGDNTGQRIEVMTQASYAIENTAAAIYSQWNWRPPILDDRLSFTLGARHSQDSRWANAFRRQISFVVIPSDGDNKTRGALDIATQLPEAFYDATGDRDFRDNSFTFITEFEISDDINLYVKVADAYKSGGFNTREQITAEGEQRFEKGFDPENITAYELGLKSRLMDNRLQVNADIFQQEITDQQLNFTVPGTVSDTTVANAGESTMRGFEIDTTFLATENLLLVLNYAYLEAEISPSVNPLSGEIEDNFVFDSAPEHAYTAAFDWTLWRGDIGSRLALNATYSYTDERNGGATADFATFSADRQHDFAILNARLGLYDFNVFKGLLNIGLWGKNLADEEYSLNNVHNLPQSGRSIMFGEPRTYGLDMSYTWGS